ncbi:MAG TPA: hypothetical protein VKB53_09975, partial [Gammaproteobacteria bacterium]|nr:hypothetical protein [Gammaproteobacteria bacterium]
SGARLVAPEPFHQPVIIHSDLSTAVPARSAIGQSIDFSDFPDSINVLSRVWTILPANRQPAKGVAEQ